MAITNNPTQFGKVVDYSGDIKLIPNQWGLVNALGLFKHEYGTQKTLLISRSEEAEHLMVDRNWDERNPSIAGGKKDWITFPIPHYPVDDAILPQDIDGNVDMATLLTTGGMNLETVATVRAGKMERLRRAHSVLLEMSRLQVLKDGTVFAPNKTVDINYYTEWGITRESVGLDLASTTVRPTVGIEEGIAYLQDNLQTGDIVDSFVAICSPEFFSALINNIFVQENYANFARGGYQDGVTIGRLTANAPLDARYRTFSHGGVTFIEVRGSVAGVPYVEAGEAYMFPTGTSNFETHFAPANRLTTVNQRALESYYFEYVNEKHDIIEIMSETNFINVLKRPDQIITLTQGS